MLEVLALARRSAAGDAKVLVTGESGVGKDVIARHIHANSKRVRGPFVAVNCAGLTETLLESELFGHVKGSFTGAYRDKRGKLQMAHGGTLFLDEVGEMSLRMQALLLRFLETGEIQSVGAHEESAHVDVRVIAATNRNLPDRVAAGEFREDLLYRLRVIHVHVPPLRERREDIRVLVKHLAARAGRQVQFSDEALRMLERYRWPGNVRELQNVVERACALADGHTITPDDLPDHVRDGGGESAPAALAGDARLAAGSLPLKDAKEQWMGVLEASYLRQLLERHGGNISAAAKDAGIDRKTFHRLVTKHGIR
jgi:transcriptional regulator with PAS, ATPase and Fis domain